jgi:hypothetical protein
MECHIISTPAVPVKGGQNTLRSWLSGPVALSVKSMGQEEQEGVNVADSKKW